MEIRSIKNILNKIEDIKSKQFRKEETVAIGYKEQKDILDLSDWQKSVVDIALKYLENKNQVDNNHPLSQGRFRQIQTLEEALKELEETKKAKFKEEGIKAQANIKPEEILSLFIQ